MFPTDLLKKEDAHLLLVTSIWMAPILLTHVREDEDWIRAVTEVFRKRVEPNETRLAQSFGSF